MAAVFGRPELAVGFGSGCNLSGDHGNHIRDSGTDVVVFIMRKRGRELWIRKV